MKPQSITTNMSYGVALVLGVYLLLFSGLYHSPFQVMFVSWNREDYSYCYVVPFIVLYLFWEKRTTYFQNSSSQDWCGLSIAITGVFCYWLGELGGEFYIIYISSWLTLVGLLLLHQGFQRVKVIIFPLCFMLTMFPLPNFFNFRITLALKIISSKLGVLMMQAYGVSAYREGNIIELGHTTLQVVDACSGLRYLYPMIVLSIILSYLFKAQFWKKLLLVISSIPLTIGSNALRIALTGILSQKYGAEAVDGFFHDFEGWIIFMITLALLMGEMWLLNRLYKVADTSDKSDLRYVDLTESKGLREISKPEYFQPQFLAAISLLTFSLVLSQGVEFREEIPLLKPFKTFPYSVGKWKGVPQPLGHEFIDELDFSDYLLLDYADGSQKEINLYVAYYESQRKGESIHSPDSCLRGSGWVFKQSGKARIPLSSGEMISVNRALIEKEPVKHISYYWFPFRGRILTNAYQMKLYNFWDALVSQRTDGALVRLITPVYTDETEEVAEKRLQMFLSEVKPILNTFLPE